MMEKNTIHHADWMTNDLPDGSVNLIIADPPYFEVRGDFDFVWDSFDDYLKDVEKWVIECKRLLAENGTLFWYGDDKRIAYAQIIFDKYFNLLNHLIWHKGENFMGLNKSDGLRSFAPCTERILMYSNEECSENLFSDVMNYFEEERKKIGWNYKQCDDFLGIKASYCYWDKKTTHEYRIPEKSHYNKLQQTGFWQRPYEEIKSEYEDLRRPFDNFLSLNEVMRFNNESAMHTQYKHPTRKPEKLTRALLLTCSRPRDLVLVPFAGSGTECAMAKKENREFIGFEIDKKYHAVATQRLSDQEEKSNQTQLF